ncbi:hypothetical protein PAPYR_1549 [Paratrimastix pyriformis]|uniref:Uncharacterized protein n=1 Tax=Paratrimastix pyriformis TaxID=342808 RepID=A0ABQ8UU43_9EUKA|nr:hypothetical protein PAPYR_1549 [Paratrimastix pyriformis]
MNNPELIAHVEVKSGPFKISLRTLASGRMTAKCYLEYWIDDLIIQKKRVLPTGQDSSITEENFYPLYMNKNVHIEYFQEVDARFGRSMRLIGQSLVPFAQIATGPPIVELPLYDDQMQLTPISLKLEMLCERIFDSIEIRVVEAQVDLPHGTVLPTPVPATLSVLLDQSAASQPMTLKPGSPPEVPALALEPAPGGLPLAVRAVHKTMKVSQRTHILLRHLKFHIFRITTCHHPPQDFGRLSLQIQVHPLGTAGIPCASVSHAFPPSGK